MSFIFLFTFGIVEDAGNRKRITRESEIESIQRETQRERERNSKRKLKEERKLKIEKF